MDSNRSLSATGGTNCLRVRPCRIYRDIVLQTMGLLDIITVMSPEKAQVFYVDDDDDSREAFSEYLVDSGHIVVETAGSLAEALSKIPDLGKKGVNVAIVDGNLREGDISGSDGETVAQQIRAQHPNITIIGHSSRESIGAADINCPKIEGAAKLAKVVANA